MASVMARNQEAGQGQGTYSFSSQPRAVPQRKKYRNQEPQIDQYGNIMYDRRIVRGNTYAQHTLPASAQPDPIEIQRQQEGRRRAAARKRAKQQLRPRSPEPVEGRKHIDVQTELYLEELSDRVEEADVDCQTDYFLDRPPSPLFIPAKSGKDIATQILEGDLFEFDIEVKPILEVLVGKTIEQSLLEVMEEEELANLRAQQRSFEELRNAELVEQQRLEEQERRHREEKDRRMKQQKEILRKEKETSDKIAARAFAQSYLADLVPSVFGTLADNGYFYDPVERDVEHGFMPWLMDRVEEQLVRAVAGRMVLDGLLREVVHKRLSAYKEMEDAKLHAKIDQEIEENLAEAVEKSRAEREETAAKEDPSAADQTEAADVPTDDNAEGPSGSNAEDEDTSAEAGTNEEQDEDEEEE